MFFQGLLFELPRMLHSTCFLCQCCHEFFLLSNYTCQLMGSLLAANWINFDLLPTAFNHLALAPSHKKKHLHVTSSIISSPKKIPTWFRWGRSGMQTLHFRFHDLIVLQQAGSHLLSGPCPSRDFKETVAKKSFFTERTWPDMYILHFDFGNGPWFLGEFQTQHFRLRTAK